MRKLNFNQMETISAGGCGWLKRAAKRAEKDGYPGSGLVYANLWIACKKQ